MTRKRGQVRRAPEVQPEALEHAAWTSLEAAVPLGAWAYAWGVAWMLREVELSKVQWKHVTHSAAQKQVRLFIPHSKMDQQGLGVSRTLQCCGEQPCWKGCVWWLWSELQQLRAGRVAEERCPWMFPNGRGGQASKHEMVSSWKQASPVPVAGHLARTSSAMAYVRRGLSIQELAFLGRWKSTVVLTYAEEALQTVPANRRMAPLAAEGAKENDGGPKRDRRRAGAAPQPSSMGLPSLSSCSGSSVVQNNTGGLRSKQLWVKSVAGGKPQPLHLVANASWQMAICEWSTSCGWSFARRSAKVVLVTNPSLGAVKCQKCLELEKMRDVVKEGITPAQLVADTMESQLDATNGKGTDGCTEPANRPSKRVEGSFMEGRGFCNKGDACTFAHSDEELKNGVAYSEVAETPKEKAADVNIKAEVGFASCAAPGSPFETANFKRKMCSFFAQGQCNRGDACTFAHSAEELQGNPSHGTNVSLEEQWPEVQVDSNLLGPREFENNFKPSLLCKLWMRHPTLCRDGDACTFAHGLLELKGELEEHVGKLRAAGFFGSRAMPSEHAHSAVALCPGTGTYPMESKGSWPRNGKGGKGKDQKGQGPVSPVSHSDGNADVAAVASMAPSKYTPEDKQAMVNFIVQLGYSSDAVDFHEFPAAMVISIMSFDSIGTVLLFWIVWSGTSEMATWPERPQKSFSSPFAPNS
eukprot:Skav231059  [mRNA]  locus=scaffold768:41744:47030:+ [translate_table: standard]